MRNDACYEIQQIRSDAAKIARTDVIHCTRVTMTDDFVDFDDRSLSAYT